MVSEAEIKEAAKAIGGTGMRKITVYRDDSTAQVAGNSVLTIAQYTDVTAGDHRYIHWPRERFCWFKDEKV
jgi:hypothetical protein